MSEGQLLLLLVGLVRPGLVWVTVRLPEEVRAHTITFKLSRTLGSARLWGWFGVLWSSTEGSERVWWRQDHPGCGNYTGSHLRRAHCARWYTTYFGIFQNLKRVARPSFMKVKLKSVSDRYEYIGKAHFLSFLLPMIIPQVY